jgi:hypothetical protein
MDVGKNSICPPRRVSVLRKLRRGGVAVTILVVCAAATATTTMDEGAADAAARKGILLKGVFLVEGHVVATTDPFVHKGAAYDRVFTFETFNHNCLAACDPLRLATQPNGGPGAHHLIGLARRNPLGGVYTGVLQFKAPASCKTKTGTKFTQPDGNRHVVGYTIHVTRTSYKGLGIILRAAERISGEIHDTSLSSAAFTLRCGSRPFVGETRIRFIGHLVDFHWPPGTHGP